MRLVVATYNIQYALGQDGRYDIARIADAVAEADIILFQEVTQNWTRNDGEDQVAELAARLNRYVVFGSTFDSDASTVVDGKVVNRRRTFGNMIASRWPILSSRTQLLPKHALPETMDVQRCVVEGICQTPAGPIRAYSVHLSHISAGQRLPQVEVLMRFIREAQTDALPADGPFPQAWSGDAVDVPLPATVILGGDFNCTADSREIALVCGEMDPHRGRLRRAGQLVDTFVAAGHDPLVASTFYTRETGYKIDHLVATPDLAGSVVRSWIGDSTASDHYPVFVELDWAGATV
ncbi:endonuclease/exonuclease/phosphatase family protein [Thalassobaculum sp.]|uniref:endonuclease/exonuclease/phosphatase family protein n=1 Tax=Thalassobaculum sp. TaxID=2022740 RepID=UPI003B5B123B